MTNAGEIKGIEAVVTTLTVGATTAVGDVIHLEADGKYDPVADADKGKFAVALDAGTDGTVIRAVIWGRVTVTATAAAIKKGALVMAGDTAKVAASDTGAIGEVVGTAMEEFASGAVGTIWVGLGN